jgi:putative hydrolase of the HAD superfamily
MKDIKAVLFDFGGVFTLSPFGAVEMLARERGIDTMHFAEIVFGSYHLDTDHPWHKLERGEISLEQTRSDIMVLARQSKLEVDLWDVLTKMANNGNMVNAQVVNMLAEVKNAGYQTAIVTNNVREFSSSWQAMIPMQHVDLVIDSAFEGIRKPNPAIFQLTLQKLGAQINPAQCIFLDDVPSNVQSAINIGMQGFTVTPNPDETVATLSKILKLKK